MIKAKCTGPGGRKTLLLGIEEKNWKRLKQGKPIHVNGEEVGLNGVDVLLIGAPTIKELIEQVQPFIDDQTVVHDNLKGRGRH